MLFRSLRVSLKKSTKEENSDTLIQSKQELKQAPFTQEDLSKCWADFAKNSEEVYFKSMFQYCQPTLKENFLIEITVINPEQDRKFKEELTNIKDYLSKRLQNDLLSFEIRMNENNSSESIFTNKEKYDYLLNKNPNLGLLVKEFNLRLD